ncbi:hypothetical protein [Rodentibacter mrazii]|nr:hypothetical protein [Rodentibacter mrazii]
MPSKGWLKNVLRFMFFLILLFLVLIVIGVFAAEYLQDVDIRAWFIKTQWIWFTVRLMLYGVIGFMVLSLSRRHPGSMPAKAKWLIAMVLIFAEAITQITLS